MDEEIATLIDTKLRLETDNQDLKIKLNHTKADFYNMSTKCDNALDK